jgi:GTP-binding protein
VLPQLRGSPVVALSAETGRGLDRLMPAVAKVHKDWSTKVKTRDLNDWLKMAVQRHPPPAVNGKRIKPKYVAQTKARPPTFVLFATRADQLPDSYRRYLINSLRESFDLPGVPIRVSIRQGGNPFVAEEGARPWLADQGRGGPKTSNRRANYGTANYGRTAKAKAAASAVEDAPVGDKAPARPVAKAKPLRAAGPRKPFAKPAGRPASKTGSRPGPRSGPKSGPKRGR